MGYPCIALGKSKATFVLPDKQHAIPFRLRHGGDVKEVAWVDLLVPKTPFGRYFQSAATPEEN